jgi:hypothetical protein
MTPQPLPSKSFSIHQSSYHTTLYSVDSESIARRTSHTGCGGPQGCETSRLPHFLHNRLTDGGEVVSLTRRQAALYPHEDSWYAFRLEAESTPKLL